MQRSHLEGLDCVLNTELQEKQALVELGMVLLSTALPLEHFKTASLQFLISNFLALDCSLNLGRMTLLTNQRADLLESGIM